MTVPPPSPPHPPSPQAAADSPPAAHDFAALTHCVLSPHRAGGIALPEGEVRRMASIAPLVNAAAEGLPMPNLWQAARGY